MTASRADLLLLPPGEVHLWYLLPDEITDPALLAVYDGWLAPDERARRDRYLFDRNKHEYLLTRALVKSVLSRYAPVPPGAWAFRANQYGCPEVALAEHTWLRFNLSNTAGLVVCVVARGREVGVDVESVERAGETVGIADRFFSPVEVAELRSLPEALQRSRFFDYWTLKEAYIKARGMGLSIPLGHFSFLLRAGSPIRVAFDPRLADDATTWQFEQFALTERHRTAAAVRRGTGPDLAFVVRRTVPLVE